MDRDAGGKPIRFFGTVQDITERRRVEEALRATSEQLQMVLRCAPLAIFTRDKNALITSWSPAAEQIYGWKASEVLGKPMPLGRAREEMARAFAEVLAGAQLVERQIQRLRPDGAWMFLNAVMAPLRDASGNISGVITIASDITERKQAEEALRATSEQLQTLIRCAPLAIFTRDKNALITSWNPAAEQIYGWKASEVLGKSIPLGAGEERREEYVRVFAEVLAGAELAVWEVQRLRRDGARIVVNAAIAPLRDASGNVSGAITIASDITERKRAEEALRESEERFRSLTEMSSDFYWETDAEHRLTQHTSVGKQRTALLSRPHIQIGKRRWAMPYLSPDEAAWQAHRAVLDAHLPFRDFEFSRLGTDGSEHHLSISADPLFDASGAFKGYRGVGSVITERKQAEAARGQLAAIVENSNDAIISRTLEGTIVSWNAGAEKMFGYSATEAIGKPITFNVSPARQFNVARNKEQLLRGETISPREVQRLTKDGRVVDVLGNISPVKDGTGKIIGASVILDDITERKQAEEALRATSEQLQTLIRCAPLAIFTRDKNRLITTWNLAAERIYGWKESEVLGKLLPTVPGEAREESALVFPKVLAGAQLVERQIQRLRRDGARIFLDAATAPLRDTSGNISGVITIASDISERKRAEEALRESEARFRSYFELPIVGLAVTSPEKGWIEVNDEICSMMGYSREELLRMTWSELTHPEDLAADVEQFNRMLAGQIDTYSMDKRFIRKNGEAFWTSIAVGCARDSGGRVKHIVVLGLDITDRMRAQEALRVSLEKYRVLFESFPLGISVTDAAGHIIETNRESERLLGISRDEHARRKYDGPEWR
ncbi:MAG: PAS domain S-box protein, partial [Pseudomonadota bacterium]